MIQYAEGAKEPWLLATSLTITSKLAKHVVKIYKARMQIEEGFKDMKSEHYGLGFNASQSRNTNRIGILMLIATLAAMLLLIIGTATELTGKARNYQANTVKHRRVLSLHFLALRVIADTRLTINPVFFEQAITHMNTIISKADQGLG